MKRASKTLNNIGQYFLLTSLIPIMTFSVMLIGIEPLVNSGLDLFKYIGDWLRSFIGDTLKEIADLGRSILAFCIIGIVFIVVQLVFINSKNNTLIFIGNISSLIVGFVLFWIGAIPFFNAPEGSATFVTGMLFIYLGISGTIIVTGSVMFITAWFLDKFIGKPKDKVKKNFKKEV
ncbi:hypothetical protein SCHIN_v1c02170 [Spiroplasma chinense]|uniref:Uncharacterized protein n=1 Tax=Spiroplasma chinense TaxID=216932 RepID=A0A5B9Y2Y7_9MOLU|nr:hypothetical protein [Spiroplasma chinense]QEH61414.1 hypothetical protein SCHIN_v1c02170 [Spiroplasma chinense]